jgi:hypothetical protein
MRFYRSIFGIVLFVAALCAPALRAQDGLRGAVAHHSRASLREFPAQIAAADFDNDQVPDGAILLETGRLNGRRSFRIEVHLTQATNSAITFSSGESGLSISTPDVNQDGAPDIVIEKAFTHERLQVYLNDGHGAFRKARAEDYPSPDPPALNWRSESSPYLPAFFLVMSRSPEMASLERISILARTGSVRLQFWPEAILAQSAARAPSSSRAPPSTL